MLSLLAEDQDAVISLEPAGLRVSEYKVVSRHSGDGGVREDERGLWFEGNLTADGPDDGIAEQRLHLGLQDGLGAEVGLPGGAAGPLLGDQEVSTLS